MKITVNDINNPIILLKIFNTSTPWDKNDEELKRYSDIAMEWQGLFAVIINKGDKKVEAKAKTENNTSDEIRKLHELLKDGILTEEEFNNQKQKLLMM
ncbi:SHOCT domain-containing protein [Lysinibacillus xylanilyticus]|uniref:SHOCT domain-containing protein n=1 Tax=Lysinibacillus xylanilyticus TaxID=582475 RepID=UPI00381986E3